MWKAEELPIGLNRVMRHGNLLDHPSAAHLKFSGARETRIDPLPPFVSGGFRAMKSAPSISTGIAL